MSGPIENDMKGPIRELKIRVSLSGVLANAARHMDQLASDIREREGYDPDGDEDDPAGDADYFAAVLKMASDHAAGVESGVHTLTDFADFYCLVKSEGQ